jgi:serine/threonine protein kinase
VSSPLPQVKICDFGLSKYSSSSLNQGYSPVRAYTPEYTSPERLRAFKRSPQDDVYAFGVLLYFIATSRSPYGDISSGELKEAVLSGVRPDIEGWASSGSYGTGMQELVDGYCDLAQQCWHSETERRPGCAMILHRLSQLQHHVGMTA